MLERLKKDLSYQESFDVTFRKVDGLKKSFIIVFLNFLCNHEAIVEIIYSLEHLNLSKQKDIAKEIYNENATSITMSNITDTRGDASVCGWVKCGTPARYTNNTTITASTTTMSIGIDEYSSGDLLDVYRGGLYLVDGVDYTDNKDGTITFTNAISSGTIIFVVTKIVF